MILTTQLFCIIPVYKITRIQILYEFFAKIYANSNLETLHANSYVDQELVQKSLAFISS
jgi:hypothetical protein